MRQPVTRDGNISVRKACITGASIWAPRSCGASDERPEFVKTCPSVNREGELNAAAHELPVATGRLGARLCGNAGFSSAADGSTRLEKVVAFWSRGKKMGCYALIACISGTTPKICIARFML